MSNLKNKFKKATSEWFDTTECEQITDDFSVKLLEWFEKNVNQLLDMNYIYKGSIYTDKKQLQQYFKDNIYK